MSQRRLTPPCRYVYVIGPETGLQKIGVATNPRARLAALQTASPFKLMIHASVAVPFGAAHAVERRAHEALGKVRAAGEWFNATAAEAVAAVRAAAAPFRAAREAPTLPLFAFADAAPLAEEPSTKPGAVHSIAARAGLDRLWQVAKRGFTA